MAARLRVLIVDDDVPTRVGLRTILASAGDIDVIGEASGGDDAVVAVAHHDPDVVLMDIRLPGMDGLAATRKITRSSRSKVIVLTTFDFEEYAFQSQRAGASAFILKRAPAEELIGAVRAVAGGATGDAQLPVGVGDQPRAVSRTGELSFTPAITEREREVLNLVAQGLTNLEVGTELHLSVDTVKSHLKHIYAKSGIRDRARLVVAAQRSGFGRGLG